MRIINRLERKEIIVEGAKSVLDIKKELLKRISGIYYKNIIVIKEGEVLEDNMRTEESEYDFAIIPIKCEEHPTHE